MKYQLEIGMWHKLTICLTDISELMLNAPQMKNSHKLTGIIAPQTPTGSCLVKHTKFSSVGKKKKAMR